MAGLPDQVTAFADSDCAGDVATRKSTGGGLLMLGKHLIKGWNTTQQTIAMSSGEAEHYALVKAASQAKGLVANLVDFEIKCSAVVKTDSTAALGIVRRRGLGRTRHIDVQFLWVQQEVGKKTLEVQKVPTDANPADMLTKVAPAEVLNKCLDFLICSFPESRDTAAPKVQALLTTARSSPTRIAGRKSKIRIVHYLDFGLASRCSRVSGSDIVLPRRGGVQEHST